MLQVRAEPAESTIKKFRRNTCNGDQRQFGGNLQSAMIQRELASSDVSAQTGDNNNSAGNCSSEGLPGNFLPYANSFTHVI
jgi:hypothetical protein